VKWRKAEKGESQKSRIINGEARDALNAKIVVVGRQSAFMTARCVRAGTVKGEEHVAGSNRREVMVLG